jgi:hypothetical protein
MRKRNLEARVEVENPEVKARVLAVLLGLSGEKTLSEICQETGLKAIQYYKLEAQLLKGMVMAAEASLQGKRGRRPILDANLGERNERLRRENLRMQAMLRLTRKLFKVSGKRRLGRPPGSKTKKAPTPAAGTKSDLSTAGSPSRSM